MNLEKSIRDTEVGLKKDICNRVEELEIKMNGNFSSMAKKIDNDERNRRELVDNYQEHVDYFRGLYKGLNTSLREKIDEYEFRLNEQGL